MLTGRYGGTVELVQLIVALRGTRVGLTLDGIQQRFAISRRTAERRLGAVRELFPTELQRRTLGGTRHWRLSGDLPRRLVQLEPDELVALEEAFKLLGEDGHARTAATLGRLAEKMRALFGSL